MIFFVHFAEVMHYDELHELGTEAAVKAAGKYRQEGKTYIVKHRYVTINTLKKNTCRCTLLLYMFKTKSSFVQ